MDPKQKWIVRVPQRQWFQRIAYFSVCESKGFDRWKRWILWSCHLWITIFLEDLFWSFFFPKIFTASHKNHFQRCWICISCLQMDQSHDSWRIETSGSTVFWGIFSLSGDGGIRRIPTFRGRMNHPYPRPPGSQDSIEGGHFFFLCYFQASKKWWNWRYPVFFIVFLECETVCFVQFSVKRIGFRLLDFRGLRAVQNP